MRLSAAEYQKRYRQRQKAALERLRMMAAKADPTSPGKVSPNELRAVLDAFEERLVAELAKSASERRQTNDKVDRLSRQLMDLRRALGDLESPQTPRISRRRPLGHD
jgi:hypothetical protein